MSRNGPGLVLMYHRVAETTRDPFWLSVRPDSFSEHLNALEGIAEVVPFRSILDPDQGPRVAITFDDGYRDNLDQAYPRLRETDAPATVFVTSTILESTTAFWWDRLEHVVLEGVARQPSVNVTVGGRVTRIELNDPEQRDEALAKVQELVRGLPPAEIEDVVDDIADQVTVPPDRPGPPALLDEEGLRGLARDGLVDIGGHTRSHAMLSGISADKQWSEIAGGKRALERVLDKPVTAFAYPFGNRRSFSMQTTRLVKKAGFALACTTRRGRVTRRTRRYRIPRLAVHDWDGDRFAREVWRALAGKA
jgi:peptidoglycan/xylan/chitin deacetylase (PgdA/CDA1 family)